LALTTIHYLSQARTPPPPFSVPWVWHDEILYTHGMLIKEATLYNILSIYKLKSSTHLGYIVIAKTVTLQRYAQIGKHLQILKATRAQFGHNNGKNGIEKGLDSVFMHFSSIK